MPEKGAPNAGKFETSPQPPPEPAESTRGTNSEFDDVRSWLANQVDALRCPAPRKIRRFELRIYVACGETGLLILAVKSPFELVERRELGGSVSDLLEHDGRLIALVQNVENRVIAGPEWNALDASHAPPLPPSERRGRPPRRRGAGTPLELPDVRGTVKQRDRAAVVVDMGETDGLISGMRLALFPDTAAGKDGLKPVVGVVRSVADQRALVDIGINELVEIGYLAEPTHEPRSGSSTLPPRPPSSWSVALLIRPFVGLDQSGGGALVDASVGRRFSSAFHLRAQLEPLGVASGETGTAVSATAFVSPSYDHALVEVGLGLGFQTVNETTDGFEPGSGTLFAPFARLGASDGLSLNARLDMTLFHQELHFMGLRLELQTPIDQGTWLLARGGGGGSGYGYGELGLRHLLTGNGGKGSTSLVFVLGGTSVFEQRCQVSESFAFCGDGPIVTGAHMGAGFEARL